MYAWDKKINEMEKAHGKSSSYTSCRYSQLFVSVIKLWKIQVSPAMRRKSVKEVIAFFSFLLSFLPLLSFILFQLAITRNENQSPESRKSHIRLMVVDYSVYRSLLKSTLFAPQSLMICISDLIVSSQELRGF